MRLRDEFEPLQRTIGYRFRDRGLLEHALTHTSRANEDVSGGVRDNESMEFLGDALLGFVIADALFREFPESNEGAEVEDEGGARLDQRRWRARPSGSASAITCCSDAARRRPAAAASRRCLADGYEALLAAIYLDGGIEPARAFILREFAALIADVHRHGVSGQDYKSALQELLQARDLGLPEYRLAGTLGPDHRKQFQVEVAVQGEVVSEAIGSSKKEAEQEASASGAREVQVIISSDIRCATASAVRVCQRSADDQAS